MQFASGSVKAPIDHTPEPGKRRGRFRPNQIASVGSRLWAHRSKLWHLGAAAVLGLCLGLSLVSFSLSSRYVESLTQGPCLSAHSEPEGLGLPLESVSFRTDDDLSIAGRYLPSENGAVIILLEGHGMRGFLLGEGQVLAHHGYGLLSLDWRGCGASDPARHTLGIDETRDLLAAVQYLSHERGVDAIGALGFSVGGAVAIRTAAVEPRIVAVVAMGNYHDLEEEIYKGGHEAPAVSWVIEHQVAWLFQRRTGIDFDQVPQPIDVVGQLSPRPLLLIYGEGENGPPDPSGLLLYRAAGEPKELWIVPGVGHGGYLLAQPAEFERRVLAFFDRALLH